MEQDSPPVAVVVQRVMSDGFGDAASAILASFALQRLTFGGRVALVAWFDDVHRPQVAKRQQLLFVVAKTIGISVLYNDPKQTQTDFVQMIGTAWSQARVRIVSCLPRSDKAVWLREALQRAWPLCRFASYTEFSVMDQAVECLPPFPAQDLCITTGFGAGGVLQPLPLRWNPATPQTKRDWLQWFNVSKSVALNDYRLWLFYCGCDTPKQVYQHKLFVERHVLPELTTNPGLVAVIVMPKCSGSTTAHLHQFDRVQYIASSVSFGWMRSLMKNSGDWVGITGDQSLVEAISVGKYVQYEETLHKQGLFQAYLRLLFQFAKIGVEEFDTLEDLKRVYSTQITHAMLIQFGQMFLKKHDLFGPGKPMTKYVTQQMQKDAKDGGAAKRRRTT